MRDRYVLIDGDIEAYREAAANQDSAEWAPGKATITTDWKAAVSGLEHRIESYAERFKAEPIVCLSDPEHNWRKAIYRPYKSNRNGIQKPAMLVELRDWLKENYRCYQKPGLEADDVIGILMTWDGLPGRKCAISIDKDFRQIPGFVFNPARDEKPVRIAEVDADKQHLLQTLTGDPVDGYPGCPGVGPERAKEWFEQRFIWESFEHEFRRGGRKGQTETRWRKRQAGEAEEWAWQGVVSWFARAGLTDREALAQARVARILRAEDYDFERQEVRLWSPAGQA